MRQSTVKPVVIPAHDESAATLTTPQSPDAETAITAWLNVFARLLHLPETQRQAIRSELQEHLRERVRDLLLVGRTETESVRLAIEELGETVQLARRFEAANKPRIRRWLMNLSLIGLACGAVVVSAVTLAPGSPSPAAVFQEQDEKTQAALEQIGELRVNKIISDALVEQAVKEVTKDLEVSIIIRKAELQAANVLDHALSLEFKRTPLPTALDMIVQEVNVDHEPIEWRIMDDNVIEIGVKSEMDRRDITLVSYDVREIINSICESFNRPYENAVADVVSLLHHMVEPELWRDNGGDLAHLQVVGGRMFVQAPARMHKQVDWIIQQLREDASTAADPEKTSRIPPEMRSTLQPGDSVSVRIFELYEPGKWFSTTREVDGEGLINVPVAGELKVAGLKRRDVEKRINDALKDTLVNPQVDVTTEIEADQPAAPR